MKQVNYKGRSYNFPDDATPQEITQFIDSVETGEQIKPVPSRLEETFMPGGLASPENVGIVTGGTLGAIYGTPFFPPFGTIAGGLIGAGIGGGFGRTSEIIGKKLGAYEPYTSRNIPSTTEAIQSIGEATERGITAQTLGLGLGAIGGKVLAPFARRMTPSISQAIGEAQQLGVPLTAGETLLGTRAGSTLSMLERQPPRLLGGVGTSKEFLDKRIQQIEKDALDMAERLSPGTAKDVEIVGKALKVEAQKTQQEFATLAKTVGETISPGAPDILTAGEAVQTGKEKAFDAVRAAAGRLYTRVKELAGERGNEIQAINFLDAAREISKREASLGGVQTPGAGVAGKILGKEEKARIIPGGGTQFYSRSGALIDPARLPADLIHDMSLDQPTAYSFDALRTWQSRLGELIRTTPNRQARRDWVQLFDGVTKDIEAFGEGNPDLLPMLRQANDFYRTQVAEVYFKDVRIGKIDSTDADLLQKLFIRPQGSVVSLQRLQQAVGKPAYDQFVAAHMNDLVNKATDVNGFFDADKYLQIIHSYKPEILKQLVGNKSDDLNTILAVFKAAPTDLIKAIANKEDDKVLEFLMRKNGSTGPLTQVRSLVDQKTYNQFAGAAWKRVIQQSVNNAGEFSPDLFLTQVNSRTGYTQEQLKLLLGDQYPYLQKMVNTLERIKQAGGIGLNPSGTAGALLAHGQIIGGIAYATALPVAATAFLAPDISRGQTPSLPKVIAGGLILMSPKIMAKILYSPGGIKWLTEGLTTSPGTQHAIDVASRLMAIAALPDHPIPEGVKENTPEGTSPTRLNLLQREDIPLEQKIQAAQGFSP